ncbi:MAG: DNA integrity scanning diadenylate cyclase DisA [Bacillota bacterium]|jgi:diadenylate cyclase|nr:DNA integrity scanning diadenylate cyclase DisA [Bacillota bacterium]
MRENEMIYRDLALVAPGTQLYEGLESILKAKTGALIVIGDTPEVLQLVSGGFRIDSEMHPAALYELAKMDGAIVLSTDTKRILYANAQLIPDPMIPSSETGTRHKTAERVAKQTGQLVISISQRRNVITIYKGNAKYILRDVSVILAKANQALSTLEKYRSVFRQSLVNLSALEFEDLVTLTDVATVLQRSQMVARIASEIESYVLQLGSEGRLVKMQLEELMSDIKDEGLMVFKDYYAGEVEELEETWTQIVEWDSDDLLNPNMICKALGHGAGMTSLEQPVTPRGYRILAKIPRLPMPVVENLVKEFQDLPTIVDATIEELDDVEGIGEVRARAIQDGLRRIREQVLVDSHI